MEEKEWLVIRGKNYRPNIGEGVTSTYIIECTPEMLKNIGVLFGQPERRLYGTKSTCIWYIAYECFFFSFDMTLVLNRGTMRNDKFFLYFYDSLLTHELMYRVVKMIEGVLKGIGKTKIERN